MSFIAGKFVQQFQYKSFLPSKLDKNIDWQTGEVLELLSEANRMIGELNAYASLVPDVNFFIEMHKVKEATTSCKIEGTQTNVDDVLLSEREINPEKRNDWEEVRNYIEALNRSIQRLDEIPLSMRLLREAHKILLSGVRGEKKQPGEIRISQNWIGGADIKSATFIPPHHNDVPDLLSDLEKFWHSNNPMPHLIRIAISHYQFETIHPFLDGNGRIGRLLIILQLIHHSLLEKPVLYLSDFFEKNRTQYYDSLERVRVSNNLDQWLRFFLTGIVQTSKNSKETFIKIGSFREKYSVKILKLGKRAKLAQSLLNLLYSNPVITPREVENKLEVTPATANRLLAAMEEQEILSEKTGFSRNRLFELTEYLDIFRQ
ncbi:MAG: Fic family protein [Bacteroidales bacterium]